MLPPTDHLRSLIERSASFVLTTHVNPDGDGLGSELAMYHYLTSLNKGVVILNHSETPENYRWMDTRGVIVRYDADVHARLIMSADVIMVLDTNQSNRLRSMEAPVLNSAAVRVVIDHHLEAQDFADQYFIDSEATSTGEIIYRLLLSLGVTGMSPDIATALYTAIMTDTGSYRYPRTDPDIHRITAHLLECGVDPTLVYANVFEVWTPGRMRLLGEMLDSLKTSYDGKLAYVVCTREMFHTTGTSVVDTDNFTNYPMSIAGVHLGILINELADGVKVSFRSKGTIAVNELAKEFGGNGHLNAAGARIHAVSLSEIIPRIVAAAGPYLQHV